MSLNRSWHDPQQISKSIIDDYQVSMSLPDWSKSLSMAEFLVFLLLILTQLIHSVEMVKVSEHQYSTADCANLVNCPVTIIQGADDKVNWQLFMRSFSEYSTVIFNN